MFCLSICLYCFALAYWILDIIIVQQELLGFLPAQLSVSSGSDTYGVLTRMLGRHWYAQTVFQTLIVSSNHFGCMYHMIDILATVDIE